MLSSRQEIIFQLVGRVKRIPEIVQTLIRYLTPRKAQRYPLYPLKASLDRGQASIFRGRQASATDQTINLHVLAEPLPPEPEIA